MKPLTVLILILTIYSCARPSKETLQQRDSDKKIEFYQAIQNYFASRDSLLEIDPNAVDTGSVKLQAIISQYKSDVFTAVDTFRYHPLFVVKSPDNKLCLISWNTRMGGTMIDYATMAIYKSINGETVLKMLLDSTNDFTENTLMHYDSLFQFHAGRKTFYIAHGFGQGSTALPWQELRAFTIDGNQLVTPNIFPELKPNLFVEFDTHQIDREKIPMIIVKDSGRKISSPIPNDDEGFSGKYQNFSFRDTGYIRH